MVIIAPRSADPFQLLFHLSPFPQSKPPWKNVVFNFSSPSVLNVLLSCVHLHCSTATALFKIPNDLQRDWTPGCISVLSFLDLTVALDPFAHSDLLRLPGHTVLSPASRSLLGPSRWLFLFFSNLNDGVSQSSVLGFPYLYSCARWPHLFSRLTNRLSHPKYLTAHLVLYFRYPMCIVHGPLCPN